MSYKIDIGREKYHLHNDMMQWCNDNIGPGGYRQDATLVWDMSMVFGTATYYFKHEKDLTFFMLRWT